MIRRYGHGNGAGAHKHLPHENHGVTAPWMRSRYSIQDPDHRPDTKVR